MGHGIMQERCYFHIFGTTRERSEHEPQGGTKNERFAFSVGHGIMQEGVASTFLVPGESSEQEPQVGTKNEMFCIFLRGAMPIKSSNDFSNGKDPAG